MDTSKIEGYENMTTEEKLAALEAYEFDTTGYVSKETFDKAARDAADWKKKYNGGVETARTTEARLAELERKDKFSTAKDEFIASGFSVDLAKATAEAFVDGNMKEVLANITKNATEVATAAKDAALKGMTPPPASGNTDLKVDYDKKISEALASGNMTDAAYYTRLKTEQK
jgi:hypothetical protein